MKTILALLIAVWSVSAMAESGYLPTEVTTCGLCDDQHGRETDCVTQMQKQTHPIDCLIVYEPVQTHVNMITLFVGGTSVLTFSQDGEITWKGHKIESDAELKAAIIDFVRYINNPAGYVPHSSK